MGSQTWMETGTATRGKSLGRYLLKELLAWGRGHRCFFQGCSLTVTICTTITMHLNNPHLKCIEFNSWFTLAIGPESEESSDLVSINMTSRNGFLTLVVAERLPWIGFILLLVLPIPINQLTLDCKWQNWKWKEMILIAIPSWFFYSHWNERFLMLTIPLLVLTRPKSSTSNLFLPCTLLAWLWGENTFGCVPVFCNRTWGSLTHLDLALDSLAPDSQSSLKLRCILRIVSWQ